MKKWHTGSTIYIGMNAVLYVKPSCVHVNYDFSYAINYHSMLCKRVLMPDFVHSMMAKYEVLRFYLCLYIRSHTPV